MALEEPFPLHRQFEKFWKDIRAANLYAGQPRSRQSAACVAIARQALKLATSAADEALLLEAWRMLYYTLTANEEYRAAIPYCELAIAASEKLKDYRMASRIRLGYISALMHDGQYKRALEISSEAEQLMKVNGDEEGYARLCTNIANIYHRLDQHNLSYDYYRTASDVFRKIGDRESEAKVYLNLGNTFSQINRFDESDQMYERAEHISNELKLAELWAQANYNRAYLYYLRGRYSDALQAFSRLREHFHNSGSLRHCALCDLDETEIYLQLNLSADAAALANSAMAQFESLGMAYEAAKAQAFYGIALSQMRRFGEATEVFRAAQRVFEEEGNEYWVGVLDLHRADLKLSLQNYSEAHSLAMQATQRFETLGIPSRRIASLVLLGRIAVALGDLAAAKTYSTTIFSIIERSTVPLMLFPCYVLSAAIAELQGNLNEAESLYALAARDLEDHHARLRYDDLRVTFLEGKNQVYEALVRLSLQDARFEDAYRWCERAKSRGLIELLSNHFPSIPSRSERPLMGRIRRLREELNGHYTQSKPERRWIPSEANYEDVALKEQELARSLREIAFDEPEYASLQQVSIAQLEAVQRFIPERTTVVEYFSVQDEIMAFVIRRDGATVIRRIATPAHVELIQDRLSFQLETSLLGQDYVRAHSGQILETTNHHLNDLYRILFEPLIPDIQTPHVTIIPHGTLHFVPFHALFDGKRYVIDQFEISYAPSASVLKYCLEKEDIRGAEPVIIGVSDENAPLVEEEVLRLKSIYPEARTLTSGAATRDAFADAVRQTSFLHVATHATFRQDNPMFSSFKLTDGYITALDLFSMTCQTNLVTLSGCKSGVSRVSASDDLLGLMRGFLYAGARSLMLSLWNVSDETTVALMTHFYGELRRGASKPQALQRAMQIVRGEYPNPFFWAPFVLIGKT